MEQSNLALTQDPVLRCADILDRMKNVDALYKKVISKPKPAPKKEVPNFANIQVAVKPLAPKAGTASLFGKKAPAGSPFAPKAKTNPFAVKPKASPFPPKPVTTPVTAPATNTAAPVQPAPQTETVPVGQVSLS